MKEKVGKLHLMKIRDFCASKDTFKKVQRHLTAQETTLANHISDKKFEFRIHKILTAQ